MVNNSEQLYTIGDLGRDPRLEGFGRRQIEYAISEAGIQPLGRLGIIRAFGESQVNAILAAVRKTARRRSQAVGVKGSCTQCGT